MSIFAKQLHDEWDKAANNKSLDDYTSGSKYRAHWICSANPNHKWEARLSHRVNGTKCPYCANRILVAGENDLASRFPELAKEWSSTNAMQPADVVFGYAKKVSWKCSDSHTWEDTVSNRTLLGRGCPYCKGAKPIQGKNDLATLYPELIKEWSSKNLYSPQDVLAQSNKKPTWVCHKGHEWETSIAHRTAGGTNCPYCANQKILTGFNDFESTHSDSPLMKEWSSKNKIKTSEISAGYTKKVIWECELNHEWEVTISARLRGYGCPYCANRFMLQGFNDLQTTHPEIATEWSKRNSLTTSEVLGANDEPMWWECDKGHEWQSNIYSRKQGFGNCPNCNSATSTPEKEIAEFLDQFGFEVQRNDRKTLKGLELDFYIPEKNIAIEFNGLYWHTEANGKDKTYHYNKWLACKDKGIQLIQIWSDDWKYNPELVKKLIAETIGEMPEVKNVIAELLTKDEAEYFISNNHVKAYDTGSFYVGLKDETTSDIIASCILREEASDDGSMLSIVRYAASHEIEGGFAKLIEFIENTYSPTKIIASSNNDMSDGSLYAKNGFSFDCDILPESSYLIKGKRVSIDAVDGYPLNGLERIWDAGKVRWVKVCAPAVGEVIADIPSNTDLTS